MSSFPLLFKMKFCYGGNENLWCDDLPVKPLVWAVVGGMYREQGKDVGERSWRRPRVLQFGSGGRGSDNPAWVCCFHSWEEGESSLPVPAVIGLNSQWV